MAINRPTNAIIRETSVDIEVYPGKTKAEEAKESKTTNDRIPHENNELTIGDLHGNALKLLHFLVRQKVINLDEPEYVEFVKLYKKNNKEITKEDLDVLFENILAKMTANPVGTVRLIGDEFADRGANDYFTLKIIEKLNQLKVPYEIIASNHGIELISQAESKDKFKAAILVNYSPSMSNLQELIEKGLVKREQVDQIINNHVKPALRPISYTLSAGKITIYSHAGIGLDEIASMAKKLGIPFEDDNPDMLADTINKINDKFSEYAKQNRIMDLFPHEALCQAGNPRLSDGIDPSTHPFVFSIWNRKYSNLRRPRKHRGYTIDFVHGHDLEDPAGENIYNLDKNNILGKNDWGRLNHQGTFEILFSQETPSHKLRQSGYFESKEFIKKQTELSTKRASTVAVFKTFLAEKNLLAHVESETCYEFVREHGDLCFKELNYLLKQMNELRMPLETLPIVMRKTEDFNRCYEFLSKLTKAGMNQTEENLLLALQKINKKDWHERPELERISYKLEEFIKVYKGPIAQETFRILINYEHYNLKPLGDLLATLYKNRLANKETLAALESSDIESLNDITDTLIVNKIFNHQVFVFLAKISADRNLAKNIEKVVDNLVIIKKHGLLTPQLLQQLSDQPENIDSFTKGFSLLAEAKLLKKYQSLILSFPAFAENIAQLVCYLEKNKELTQDKLDLIKAHPEYAKSIYEVLNKLSTFEKINPEWKSAVFKQPKYAKDFFDNIRWQNKMTGQKELEYLYKTSFTPSVPREDKDADSNKEWHIKRTEDLLKYAEILNEKTQAILKSVDARFLFQLEKATKLLRDNHLLTEENFAGITNLFSQAYKAKLTFIENKIDKVIQKDCFNNKDLVERKAALEELGVEEEEKSTGYVVPFLDTLHKTYERRQKFQESKEYKFPDRLRLADLIIIDDVLPLFERLEKAGLIHYSKSKRSQEVLNKLFQMPESFFALRKELVPLPNVSLNDFNEAIERIRQKQLQSHPKGAFDHSASLFVASSKASVIAKVNLEKEYDLGGLSYIVA